MQIRARSRAVLPVTALAVVLLAASCAEADGGTAKAAGDPSPSSPETLAPTETDSPEPRLAITYDGGVLVVDVGDGEVLLDEPVENFTRLTRPATAGTC